MLKSLKEAHLKDLLDLEADNKAENLDLGELLSHSKQVKKPLLIPDYVVNPKETEHDDDRELFAGSGYRVCLKASKLKPRPENVSVPQWISANARILLKLIREDANMAVVKAYTEYTAEIGDYLQTCATSSVFILDDAHRRQVSKGETTYDRISEHQRYFYLQKSAKNDPQQGRTGGKAAKKGGPVDEYGREVCRNWNKRSGCQFINCKFQHGKCSICLATDHKAYDHGIGSGDKTPPRFRDAQGAT